MKRLLVVAIIMCLAPVLGIGAAAVRASADSRQVVEGSAANGPLSGYRDTFDRPNPNQWDLAQLTYSQQQLANFKRADMRHVNGSLEIETQKGFFSKAGYESHFTLRGDFDIQLDCRTQLNRKLRGMEERMVFSIAERDKDAWEADFAWIQLLNKPKWSKGYLDASCMLKKKFKTGKKIKMDAFDGSLRFMRSGTKLTMYYRPKSKSKWIKMTSMKFSSADMKIIFYVSNFTAKLKSVSSETTYQVAFDTFQINSAQKIIESDI